MSHAGKTGKEVYMEIVDKPAGVRKCAAITGIPYRWLLDQMKGLNPPPHYVREGCKRPELIPAEVMEWYRQKGAVK